MPKVVHLENKRFGKLVVLHKLQSSRGGSTLWKCQCDCGNLFEASTRHLNRQKNVVRSCGCDQHRSGQAHAQWTGFGKISGHWWSSHVKHSANCKNRSNVELAIDAKYASSLFEEQQGRCFFTGEPLVIHNVAANNTASLDRIDNTVGYVPGNVRWVHKDINMMKRTYDDSYFIKLCALVSDYNKARRKAGVCPVR